MTRKNKTEPNRLLTAEVNTYDDDPSTGVLTLVTLEGVVDLVVNRASAASLRHAADSFLRKLDR